MIINKVVNIGKFGAAFGYLYTPKVKQINVNSKHEEQTVPASDIPVLLKIENHFFPASQVRSVSRFGKGCKVFLSNGDEIIVNVNYEKVADLVGNR